MKTSTLLTSMLAGAAACALATAPAVASPNIHLSLMSKAPLHFKTNTTIRAPHNTTTFSTTVDISGSVSSHFSGLLFAYTWYTRNSAGVCVQPAKQRQSYKFPRRNPNGSAVPGSTVASNPCGTGNFTYFGPIYTAGFVGPAKFKGKLKAKNFYGENLVLKEVVTLNVT